MKHRTEHLIESYFAGKLTADEQAELKTLLATDKEAADEFQWQQKLAKDISKLKLSGSIQNDQWRESTKPPFRTVKIGRYLLAAAAAVALIFAAYYFMSNANDLSGNNMAGGFEHYPNKMKFKNLGGEGDLPSSPDVIEAFAQYDQKNYDAAVSLLIPIFNAQPDNDAYRFYLGVSFIGGKNDHQAINVLMPLAQNTNSTYATPAKYYLGLCFKNVEDEANAKKYLEAYLSAPDGVMFKKQAKQLLKTL